MKNLFGTDGIRSHIGLSPLTQEELVCLGTALGEWAQKKYRKSQPQILIAHDTRASCSWVKSCLKVGLLSKSVTTYDAQVLPTPGASVIMQTYELLATLDCALIISASHNPYHDNGIKIIDHVGKLSSHDELLITKLFHEHRSASHSALDYRSLGHDTLFETCDSLYCAKIANYFEPNFLKGLTIVLDCAHGATFRTAPRIFKKLGATVITINNKPNGYNINENCGAVHPEQLQQAVLMEQADAGFAFDGDGDRVVAVSKQGVIKNGDDILALLAYHPAYAQQPAFVGTVMTNYGLEQFLKLHNKSLLRTAVGDKYITQKLEEENLLLGSEPSGHVICKDLLMTGDGTLAALRVMESICMTGNFEMETFEKYPSTMINIPAQGIVSIDQEPCASIIARIQKMAPQERIVVRASGTEPVIRIMVEASTQANAEKTAATLAYELKTLLQQPAQETNARAALG